MKLWRRRATQEQTLRSVSAYSSENSYTEEPYMNPDSQSAVYAELAPGLNTYSEIPDPGRPLPHRLILSDYGYGNSAYAISEPNSEPADSSSTPSSAYYSDVSNDARVNKKKRKKKRGNGRDPNDEAIVSSLGSNITVPPPSLPKNIIRTEANLECFPVTIQALPHTYSLERHVPSYPCMTCAPCSPRTTLPFVRPQCNIPPAVLNSCSNAFNIHHPIYHTEVHPSRPSVAAVTSLLGRMQSQAVTSTTGVHQVPSDHNIVPGHLNNQTHNQNIICNPRMGSLSTHYDHSGLHPNALVNHHHHVKLQPVINHVTSDRPLEHNFRSNQPPNSLSGLIHHKEVPANLAEGNVGHNLPLSSTREYTNLPFRPTEGETNVPESKDCVSPADDLHYSPSEYV